MIRTSFRQFWLYFFSDFGKFTRLIKSKFSLPNSMSHRHFESAQSETLYSHFSHTKKWFSALLFTQKPFCSEIRTSKSQSETTHFSQHSKNSREIKFERWLWNGLKGREKSTKMDREFFTCNCRKGWPSFIVFLQLRQLSFRFQTEKGLIRVGWK